LERLEVELLDSSAMDSGWDVFTLRYSIDSPLNTIFTKPVMMNYLKIYNFLLSIKRAEMALAGNSQKGRRHRRMTTETRPILARCNFLTYEMKHFVRNFMNYVNTEVVESNWNYLMEALDTATDIMGINALHKTFLDKSLEVILLSEDNVFYQLISEILRLVLQFAEIRDEIYEILDAEDPTL
jgi:hypothetical protein